MFLTNPKQLLLRRTPQQREATATARMTAGTLLERMALFDGAHMLAIICTLTKFSTCAPLTNCS